MSSRALDLSSRPSWPNTCPGTARGQASTCRDPSGSHSNPLAFRFPGNVAPEKQGRAGIELSAVSLVIAGFLKQETKRYHQKYHHSNAACRFLGVFRPSWWPSSATARALASGRPKAPGKIKGQGLARLRWSARAVVAVVANRRNRPALARWQAHGSRQDRGGEGWQGFDGRPAPWSPF